MKTLIKLEINRLFNKKNIFYFLLIGLIIFSLEERTIGQLSKQQFILNLITEHYYLTYFMIPIFLLTVYGSLQEDMESVLIRSKSYWRYFKSKVVAYGVFSSVFVIIQIIVAFIMSIGLESDSSFKVPNNATYELFHQYSKYFNNAIEAIVISSIYMIIGLFVISIIFISINNFFNKKNSAKIIIFIYVLMNLGLKIPNLSDIPVVFMDNYIIFHRNFNYDFKLVVNLMTILVLFIIVFILNKKYWNKSINLKLNKKKPSILTYYKRILLSNKNVLIIIGILVLMCFWKLLKSSGEYISLNEYFINMFLGHSVNSVNIIEFIEMLVLNLTPLYILAVFIEHESKSRTLFVNIRMKNGTNWTKFILKVSISFILIYIVLNIVIPILIGLFMKMSIEKGFLNLISTIFMAKFLDLTLQFLIIISIYSLSRNITLSFLGIVVLNSICFLPFKWCLYLPMGMSSLSRFKDIVGEYGNSLFIVTLILLTLNILMYNYIKKHSYKKILIN